MNRKLAVFAAALAAFVFTAQAADAGQRKPIDPTLTVVSIGVGAASTAAYFGIKNSSVGSGGAFVFATVGCAALSPIVATAVLNRPLKYREAHILVGSCVVPVIGGWLVNEAYNAGWLWAPDEKPVHKVRHRRKK
jgi:hypothetical protein